MQISLQSSFLYEDSIDLLTLSTDCVAVDLDTSSVHFKITVKTQHAFPEHADKPVSITIPNPIQDPIQKVMERSDLWTRSELLTLSSPLHTRLNSGDRVIIIYGLGLKNLGLTPRNKDAIESRISIYTAIKVINETRCGPTDFQSELARKKEELNTLCKLCEDDLIQFHTGVLTPPESILSPRTSEKKSSIWIDRAIELNVLASGTFF